MMPRVSDNPIFAYGPLLGFYADGEQARFIFWRKEAAPPDWQGGRDLVANRVYGGRRTLYQDIGADPLRLKTGAWFQSKADFQRFKRLSASVGQLWMNADYTAHRDLSRSPAEQVIHRLGMHYAIFDNVVVTAITDETLDNDGGVRCKVQFEREDFTW